MNEELKNTEYQEWTSHEFTRINTIKKMCFIIWLNPPPNPKLQIIILIIRCNTDSENS